MPLLSLGGQAPVRPPLNTPLNKCAENSADKMHEKKSEVFVSQLSWDIDDNVAALFYHPMTDVVPTAATFRNC